MQYRKEIDGLRAIAVLPVIFFHAGLPFFGGGFVGVDIFFVISGFLITSNILADTEKGTFSLSQFYIRRIRRIYPALMTVVLTTVPFAWFYMFPYQLVDFGQSILSVLTFSSNVLFWQESGYFLAVAEEKPLLHTWSLSVEEQFYIIFPLLLSFLVRQSRRLTMITLAVLFFSSLAVAEYGWRYELEGNFYLIPGRVWELLTGSFIGIYFSSPKRRKFSIFFERIAEITGLVLIATAILFFKKETPTPSLQTLLPVMGAALIILFAKADSLVGRLLSSKVLVALGLLSYSAYLWHQPMFAFLKLTIDSPSLATFGFFTLLTFVLAYFSWKLIERPFRDRNIISTQMVFFLFGTTTLTLGGLGFYLASHEGHYERFSSRLSHNIPNPYRTSQYRRAKFDELRTKKEFSNSSQPKLAVIGDSFAEDMVNMIFENNAFKNFEVITHMIPARCQIYYGADDIFNYIAPVDRALCSQDYNSKLLQLAEEADVIIMSSYWHKWAIQRLDNTLKNIPKKTTSKIYIIGKKIFGTVKITDLNYPLKHFGRPLAGKYFSDFLEIEKHLKNSVHYATYISMHDLICGTNGNICMVFTPQGELISEDNEHMTKYGAKYIGSLLFTQTPLKRYR